MKLKDIVAKIDVDSSSIGIAGRSEVFRALAALVAHSNGWGFS